MAPKRFTLQDIKDLVARRKKLEGDADGVLFLGPRIKNRKVLIASIEYSAIPFLKSPSDEWLKMNPDKAGISTSAGFDFFAPDELKELSRKEERPIRHLLRPDCEGTQSPFSFENISCWRFVKKSKRLYLVYFDGLMEEKDDAFDS